MKNKVINNAGWIIGCKIIKAFLTLTVTMITARYFGPSNYGLINYAASIVTFVTPLMKLGLDSILVNEVVNDKKNEGEIIGTSVVINTISSILCIIGIVTFVLFANPGEKETLIVCFLYSLLLIFQAAENIQYWFQAKLLSKFPSIAMLISYVIVTLFQFGLLALKLNVYYFALSYSLDYLIISTILFIIYKKYGNQKLTFSYKRFKQMFSKSKYYIVSSMMVTIFSQTDKVMLKLMIDNTAVGFYSAATTSSLMVSFVFAAIIDSGRPMIFEAHKRSKEDFENKLIYLYCIIIYFSLFVSICITLAAPLIIKIMYGNSYIQAIPTLRLVVWFTTFSYLGTIRNIWILAENKQKYLWVINLSGAILNIILNLVLIKVQGTFGAALASLITQIFTNVIMGFVFKPIYENNTIMIKALNFKIIKKMFKIVVLDRNKSTEKV